jgi:hypothetical protein
MDLPGERRNLVSYERCLESLLWGLNQAGRSKRGSCDVPRSDVRMVPCIDTHIVRCLYTRQ